MTELDSVFLGGAEDDVGVGVGVGVDDADVDAAIFVSSS